MRRSPLHPFVSALLAFLLIAPAVTAAACPDPPEDAAARVKLQRNHLAGLAVKPNAIFAFADCAVGWADGVPKAADDPPALQKAAWQLVADLENVLSRAAKSARKPENALRYRGAWKALGRGVIESFKTGSFAAVALPDKRKFILYHAANMQEIGPPGAQEYIEDIDGLAGNLFGPDIVAGIVRAMDSCAKWNFKEGANRSTEAQRAAMCSADCVDYMAHVVTTLKTIDSLAAKSAVKKYDAISRQCAAR